MNQYQNKLMEELSEFKKERESNNDMVDAAKGAFAAEITKNMGSDIKEVLSAEEPPKKKDGPLKRFFKKFVETCS